MSISVWLGVSIVFLCVFISLWVFVLCGFPHISKVHNNVYSVRAKTQTDMFLIGQNFRITIVKALPRCFFISFSSAIALVGLFLAILTSTQINMSIAARIEILLYAVVKLCMSFRMYLKAGSLIKVILLAKSGETAVVVLTVLISVLVPIYIGAILCVVIISNPEISYKATIVFLGSEWLSSLISMSYNTFPVIQRAMQQRQVSHATTMTPDKQYCSASFERLLVFAAVCAATPLFIAFFIRANINENSWGPPTSVFGLFLLNCDIFVNLMCHMFSARTLWEKPKDKMNSGPKINESRKV
jgi:hypothetical protein